jgi:hypothetical protein
MQKTVAQALASAIQARRNCINSGNAEWKDRHEETIEHLVKEHLPSGAGIDGGCTIDLDKSFADKLVIHTSFHHMHDSGMYDGWTEHTVTIRPAFSGFRMSLSGRDRNGIKEYLADTFHHALSHMIEE